MDEREVGASLPWLDYGQDFGRSAWRREGGFAVPDRRERMRRELGRLAAGGARLVRPWLLGEFPTRGASWPPERIFELAEQAGHSGALAWSALASDDASDRTACLAALRRVTRHEKTARLGA